MLELLVTYRAMFFFFKQKTAYEMRISDWSSDVCSSDLRLRLVDDRTDRQFPAMVSGRARLLCGLFLGLHVARARPRDLPADLGHPGVPLHDARIRPRRPRGLCPGLLVGALCRDRARAKIGRAHV